MQVDIALIDILEIFLRLEDLLLEILDHLKGPALRWKYRDQEFDHIKQRFVGWCLLSLEFLRVSQVAINIWHFGSYQVDQSLTVSAKVFVLIVVSGAKDAVATMVVSILNLSAQL